MAHEATQVLVAALLLRISRPRRFPCPVRRVRAEGRVPFTIVYSDATFRPGATGGLDYSHPIDGQNYLKFRVVKHLIRSQTTVTEVWSAPELECELVYLKTEFLGFGSRRLMRP